MRSVSVGRLLAGGATTLLVAAATVVAAPTAALAVPQCSDGIDNDRDGRTDYPADIGCASSQDSAESVACMVTSGVTTCAGISPSSTVQRVRIYDYEVVDGTSHSVAGYVELYRFTLPSGTVLNIPCVVLTSDDETSNPCADAGGVRISTTATLIDESVAEPVIVQGAEVANVGVCNGELVATVNDIGIGSAPAYTTC